MRKTRDRFIFQRVRCEPRECRKEVARLLITALMRQENSYSILLLQQFVLGEPALKIAAIQDYRGPDGAYCQAHGTGIKEYGIRILVLATQDN